MTTGNAARRFDIYLTHGGIPTQAVIVGLPTGSFNAILPIAAITLFTVVALSSFRAASIVNA